MARMIIATLLSAGIFSFLFYILNNKICGIFKPIQRDLINLNKISSGLILGFLGAMQDTCFKNNIVENSLGVDEEF